MQSATAATAWIRLCIITVSVTTAACASYTAWTGTVRSLVSVPATASTTYTKPQQSNAGAASTACV
jgi:hypothetical protein